MIADIDERIENGLNVMIAHCEQFSTEPGNEPGFDSLVDMLTNLMHWCESCGVEFDEAFMLAKDFYNQESKDALS